MKNSAGDAMEMESAIKDKGALAEALRAENELLSARIEESDRRLAEADARVAELEYDLDMSGTDRASPSIESSTLMTPRARSSCAKNH